VSEELTMQPDDLAILALLDVLEGKPGEGGAMPWPEGKAANAANAENALDTEDTLSRLYTEVFGLLPYGLPAAAPAPAVKARLMAIVVGDETQDVEPLLQASQEPPAPAAPPAPTAIAEPPRPAPVPAPRRASTPAPPAPPRAMPATLVRRPRRWPLAAAAAIILALLGLSGYLYRGLLQQGETISRLTRQRDQLIAQEREHARVAASSEAELARLQGEMSDVQTRLAFMTSPGVEISPLRPTGQVPMPEGAFGMLFVASDHQHWHLSVKGLNPSGSGHQYQLWFIAPQGAVSGGTFTAAPGAPIHLSSAHMPAGTRAVVITLEPEAGVSTPSGPEVLRAAPPVKIS
jgi:hypothetical protein